MAIELLKLSGTRVKKMILKIRTKISEVKFPSLAFFILFLLCPNAILLANRLPTAAPTSTPATGQEPLSVRFQANADDPDGNRLTYLWDFGDPSSADNTSTDENPTHVYEGTGLHKATVVVSDGTGDKTFSRAIRSGIHLVDFLIGDFNYSKDVNVDDLRIMAQQWLAINGDTDYNGDADINGDNKVDLQDLFELATDWGPTNVALIIGIYDYSNIPDIVYADNDAADWYNYLESLWQTSFSHGSYLLGGFLGTYPVYNGLASEYKIKEKLASIISHFDENDQITIIFSGSGGGDGMGNSYFSAWDSGTGIQGEDGDLWDYELADILKDSVSRVFVFFDIDKGGGMLDDLAAMPNASLVYANSSCNENGSRIASHGVANGAWTYFFLDHGLIQHYGSNKYTALENGFVWADSNYNPGGDDEPQQFDGNSGELFYLWAEHYY